MAAWMVRYGRAWLPQPLVQVLLSSTYRVIAPAATTRRATTPSAHTASAQLSTRGTRSLAGKADIRLSCARDSLGRGSRPSGASPRATVTPPSGVLATSPPLKPESAQSRDAFLITIMTKVVNGFCENFLTRREWHDSRAMFGDPGNA